MSCNETERSADKVSGTFFINSLLVKHYLIRGRPMRLLRRPLLKVYGWYTLK